MEIKNLGTIYIFSHHPEVDIQKDYNINMIQNHLKQRILDAQSHDQQLAYIFKDINNIKMLKIELT